LLFLTRRAKKKMPGWGKKNDRNKRGIHLNWAELFMGAEGNAERYSIQAENQEGGLVEHWVREGKPLKMTGEKKNNVIKPN